MYIKTVLSELLNLKAMNIIIADSNKILAIQEDTHLSHLISMQILQNSTFAFSLLKTHLQLSNNFINLVQNFIQKISWKKFLQFVSILRFVCKEQLQIMEVNYWGNEQQIDSLQNRLSTILKREIDIIHQGNLLGGTILEINDVRYDSSYETKLQNLKEAI